MANVSTPYFPSSFASPHCIFISFRGHLLNTFVGHLHDALSKGGVEAFKYDLTPQTDEEIWKKLTKAISDSRLCIIIFSKYYASSKWCLDELVEILAKRITVIPVYYDVDLSTVRYQTGSFAEAFESHKLRYTGSKVDKWRKALAEISKVSAYHLEVDHTNEDETNLIDKIVKQAQNKLQYILHEMLKRGIAAQVNARELEIAHQEDLSKWRWSRYNTTNNAEVAELNVDHWLEVKRIYNVGQLKEGVRYEVYFCVMLKDYLKVEEMVKLKLVHPDGIVEEREEDVMGMPRNKWIELKVGEFTANRRDGDIIEMSLTATKDDESPKTGLVIQGAWIVPTSRECWDVSPKSMIDEFVSADN